MGIGRNKETGSNEGEELMKKIWTWLSFLH
jgi:hypothetical protein